ncbi:MAG: elongation factor Ts [Deltaproteobacteria bacterium]|jgi:elongation factor Ts|nr:elongation factor Ts [Deltaproteobacteria bacterium]
MSISPTMVKELREKTGAGMMDCKKALAEADGNMDNAVELLRKSGVALAAKKAGRTAADGLIGWNVTSDGKVGTLVEVNCETDFVTKTDDFQAFVKHMTEIVSDKNPADLDALMSIDIDGKLVKDVQTAVIAKIGENLGVRRFERVTSSDNQKLSQYIHAGSKIGVIAVYDDPNNKLDDATSREVAMHIAAMHPQYVAKEEVPAAVVTKEKEIMAAQMGDTNKPPEIMEKILSGKINKFYTEICLNDQVYVRDPDGKTSVAKWLTKIDDAIKVNSFVRLQVGEGVEKKQ